MARVHICIRGTETRSEAAEIAGVDRRFHHPLGRYAQNAHNWRSPLLPIRRILTRKQQDLLFGLDTRIEMPRHHDDHYLTDYWGGKERKQSVKALVTGPLTNSLVPRRVARLAVVAKEFDDGEDTLNSVGTANEVLLQIADTEHTTDHFTIWQTMAGVMIGDQKREQRGFVDDLGLLDMPETTSTEVVEHATNKFLGQLVIEANFALGRELAT